MQADYYRSCGSLGSLSSKGRRLCLLTETKAVTDCGWNNLTQYILTTPVSAYYEEIRKKQICYQYDCINKT